VPNTRYFFKKTH